MIQINIMRIFFKNNSNKQPNSNGNEPQRTEKYETRSFSKTYPQERNEEKFSKTHPQPMDIDSSIRSRLTLNKKLINNHETNQPDSDNDSEDENVLACDINFQQACNTEDPE